MNKIVTAAGLASTVLGAAAPPPVRLPSDLMEAKMKEYPQFNLSQWDNYHCLTLDKFNSWLPDSARYCEDFTLKGLRGWWDFGRDGCHEDDFPCHCAQSQVISDIIEPCIFPWENKTSKITQEELAIVQTFVTDSCTFYNATGYSDYTGCSPKINKQIYKDIKAGTAPVPRGKKCEYEAYYSDKDWVNYCKKPDWKPKPKPVEEQPPKEEGNNWGGNWGGDNWKYGKKDDEDRWD